MLCYNFANDDVFIFLIVVTTELFDFYNKCENGTKTNEIFAATIERNREEKRDRETMAKYFKTAKEFKNA